MHFAKESPGVARVCFGLCLFLSSFVLARGAESFPEYKVGEKAKAHIIAPIRLVVIDQEATDKLRQQEASRIPPFYRFSPETGDEVINEFQTAINAYRTKFLNSLEATYGRRQLTAQQLAAPRFGMFVKNFQRQNKGFNLPFATCEAWASGKEDEAMQETWLPKLKESMESYIRPDAAGAEEKQGGSQVRIIQGKPDPRQQLAVLEQQATRVARSNVFQLSRMKKDFQLGFSAEEQGLAKFLAGFLRENCIFDAELTRQSRGARINSIYTADRYEPGQIIVRQGEVITPRIDVALRELKAKTQAAVRTAGHAEQGATSWWSKATGLAQGYWLQYKRLSSSEQWLIGGGALCGFLAVVYVLKPKRREMPVVPAKAQAYKAIVCPDRNETVFVPVMAETAVEPILAAPTLEVSTSEEDWKRRALAAEQQAATAAATVKRGLLPHLAQWLSNRLFQALLRQRGYLLENQQKTEMAIANLERRLTELQGPLEARIQAYELRIAELQKELATRLEENRELLKVQIATAKEKQVLFQEKERTTWN